MYLYEFSRNFLLSQKYNPIILDYENIYISILYNIFFCLSQDEQSIHTYSTENVEHREIEKKKQNVPIPDNP